MQKTASRTLHGIPGKSARITHYNGYATYLHTTTTCTCTRNATHKCTLQEHPSVQYTMNKPTHLTISGGGLPAQCTQYLHTLTTSGERSPRARESSDEHQWAGHRLEIRRTCRGRLHEKLRTRWGTFTWNFERVSRVNESQRTCTEAPTREKLTEYLETSVPNTREASESECRIEVVAQPRIVNHIALQCPQRWLI